MNYCDISQIPTLFYGVFLEITTTSVLVSCLLCFRCSCWSAFGGGGGGQGSGKIVRNLGLCTLTLLKTKYLFLLSSSQKKVSETVAYQPKEPSLNIVLQVILNIQKKYI